MEKKVKSPIPFKMAKEMAQAFRKNQKLGTKAVWFPAQQIIDMAEALKREDADGLRIYFARYTKDIIENYNQNAGEDSRIDIKDADKNTIIFVSTRKENGKPRTDYFEDLYPFEPENRGELCPDNCPDSELLED